MRAAVQERYGAPEEVLELRDLPLPSLRRPDQVLIRVHAASVNAADAHLIRGKPYVMRAAFGWRRPGNGVAGRDVAGVVEAVGDGVRRLKVGDEVYGEISGSFAEVAVASERSLARKPANLDFGQAAAVPLAAGTALLALREAGGPLAGRSVLVNGASGGVGSFAVQLAKAMGAGRVTGVCSGDKADLVRALGADRVIDYRQEDFSRGGERHDVILDLAGRQPLAALQRALTPHGSLVLVGGDGGGDWFGPIGGLLAVAVKAPFSRQRLRPLLATTDTAVLDELRQLVEAGKVRPQVDRRFPLEQVREALRHFEAGRTRGKLVIEVRPPQEPQAQRNGGRP